MEALKNREILSKHLCDKTNPLSKEEFVKLGLQTTSLDTKSCEIRVNEYSYTFKVAQDGSWIANQGPSGNCGFINIATFTRKKSDFILWDYSEQRVVTLPNQKFGLLDEIKCSDMESNKLVKYEYVSEGKAIPTNCIWIKPSY